VLPCVCF